MEDVNKHKFSDYLSLNNILCCFDAADEEAGVLSDEEVPAAGSRRVSLMT